MTSNLKLLIVSLGLSALASGAHAATERYYFSGSVSNVIVNGVPVPSGITVGAAVSGWLDYNTEADFRFVSEDGYSSFYDNLFVNGSFSVSGFEWGYDSAAPSAIGMLSSFTNDKPMPGSTFDFVYLWTSLSKQTPFVFAPGAEYASISISGGTTDLSALESSNVPSTLDLLRFAPSFQMMQLNTDTNEQLSIFASISSVTTVPVPEPGSGVLLVIGGVVLGSILRGKRRKSEA